MKEVYQQQQQQFHQNNNVSSSSCISAKMQRKKDLEQAIKNPNSLLSVDGLLDGITALVLDCEPMRKNKNIDNFLSRC